MPFLLAERAHSESARSMCAVKGSLGCSLQERHKGFGISSLEAHNRRHSATKPWFGKEERELFMVGGL